MPFRTSKKKVEKAQERLLTAAEAGDCQMIAELMKKFGSQLDINWKGKNGKSAIWYAFEGGHALACRFLWELGAEDLDQDSGKDTDVGQANSIFKTAVFEPPAKPQKQSSHKEKKEKKETWENEIGNEDVVDTWKGKQVQAWLQKEGFGEFKGTFKKHKIDGVQLLDLSMVELFDDLGIEDPDVCDNILSSISSLKISIKNKAQTRATQHDMMKQAEPESPLASVAKSIAQRVRQLCSALLSESSEHGEFHNVHPRFDRILRDTLVDQFPLDKFDSGEWDANQFCMFMAKAVFKDCTSEVDERRMASKIQGVLVVAKQGDFSVSEPEPEQKQPELESEPEPEPEPEQQPEPIHHPEPEPEPQREPEYHEPEPEPEPVQQESEPEYHEPEPEPEPIPEPEPVEAGASHSQEVHIHRAPGETHTHRRKARRSNPEMDAFLAEHSDHLVASINLTAEEFEQYALHFDLLDMGEEELDGDTIFPMFMTSGLDQDLLADVWFLSSQEKETLNKADFMVALRYVALAQNGQDPTPENLVKHHDIGLAQVDP